MTLVDTTVVLDLVTDDPIWAEWSLHELEAAAIRGPLAINGVIYAELSVRFSKIEPLEALLQEAGLTLAEIPRSALFLAGKAFQTYRSAGGSRTGVLPDFFIGAHAAVAGWALLSRDPRRYRSYFPTVSILSPQRRCASSGKDSRFMDSGSSV